MGCICSAIVTPHLPQSPSPPATAALAPPAAAPGPRQDWPPVSSPPSAPCAAPDSTVVRCPTACHQASRPNSHRTEAAPARRLPVPATAHLLAGSQKTRHPAKQPQENRLGRQNRRKTPACYHLRAAMPTYRLATYTGLPVASMTRRRNRSASLLPSLR